MIKMTRKKYSLPNKPNHYVNRVQLYMLEVLELFLANKELIMRSGYNLVLNGYTFKPDTGICNNVARYLRFKGLLGPKSLEISDATIEALVVTWPKFSGSLAYPVEGTSLGYISVNFLWHNEDRWELVTHLRDELKKVVYEPEKSDRSLHRKASFL